MSFTRYCEGMRQPCPTPHNCQVDCHFNTADLTPSAELPEPSDWCDLQEMVAGAVHAVLLVFACLLTAVVVVGVMR